MKYYLDPDGHAVLELTRRNLEQLLLKLDDPSSARALLAPDNGIIVRAVENEEHYADRAPGECYTNGRWH